MHGENTEWHIVRRTSGPGTNGRKQPRDNATTRLSASFVLADQPSPLWLEESGRGRLGALPVLILAEILNSIFDSRFPPG